MEVRKLNQNPSYAPVVSHRPSNERPKGCHAKRTRIIQTRFVAGQALREYIAERKRYTRSGGFGVDGVDAQVVIVCAPEGLKGPKGHV